MKLHALGNEARARQEKDVPDILGLIRRCGIDPDGVEFQEILNRYADEQLKNEIMRRIHRG